MLSTIDAYPASAAPAAWTTITGPTEKSAITAKSPGVRASPNRRSAGTRRRTWRRFARSRARSPTSVRTAVVARMPALSSQISVAMSRGPKRASASGRPPTATSSSALAQLTIMWPRNTL